MLFAGESRESLRRMWIEAWRKHRAGLPVSPLEAQLADVVLDHPEYHSVLDRPEDRLGEDWAADHGESNPFLHMGLHMAVREQVSTDRPAGIRALHAALLRRLGVPHEAEHRMIEVLGATLWDAQRAGRAPDERAYLDALMRL